MFTENLNIQFFEEFKSLDDVCKDLYGKAIDNKLGVTMYLEDMDTNAYRGISKVPGWGSDYRKLKMARNLRNDLAHSRTSFLDEMCTKEDVDFVRSFKLRIFNQTDPIALLRKQEVRPIQYNVEPKVKTTLINQREKKTHKVDCDRAGLIVFAVLSAIAFILAVAFMLR